MDTRASSSEIDQQIYQQMLENRIKFLKEISDEIQATISKSFALRSHSRLNFVKKQVEAAASSLKELQGQSPIQAVDLLKPLCELVNAINSKKTQTTSALSAAMKEDKSYLDKINRQLAFDFDTHSFTQDKIQKITDQTTKDTMLKAQSVLAHKKLFTKISTTKESRLKSLENKRNEVATIIGKEKKLEKENEDHISALQNQAEMMLKLLDLNTKTTNTNSFNTLINNEINHYNNTLTHIKQLNTDIKNYAAQIKIIEENAVENYYIPFDHGYQECTGYDCACASYDGYSTKPRDLNAVEIANIASLDAAAQATTTAIHAANQSLQKNLYALIKDLFSDENKN